ncbi:MAG: DUF2726 domain-containing protein [Pseudomonadota bacterium]
MEFKSPPTAAFDPLAVAGTYVPQIVMGAIVLFLVLATIQAMSRRTGGQKVGPHLHVVRPSAHRAPKNTSSAPVKGQPSLAALSQCEVTIRPIMSKSQASLGKKLRAYADANGLALHAETSMSALLSVKHRSDKQRLQGWNAISRKRVDFCLVDRTQTPVCVVEYQGRGHWMGGPVEAEQRDKTKRAALAMARLPLLEVRVGTPWPDVETRLDALIGQVDGLRTLAAKPTQPFA